MSARPRIFLPLSLKLFGIFLLVVLMPLTLALGVSWARFNARLYDAARAQLARSVEEVERFLKSEAYTQAVQLAEDPRVQRAVAAGDRAALAAATARAMQRGYVTTVAITDARGKVMDWEDRADAAPALLPALRRAVRLATTSAQVARVGKRLATLGLVPVRARGRIVGVVGVAVLMDAPLAAWVSETVGLEASILDLRGARLASSLKAASGTALPPEAARLLQHGQPIDELVVSLGGQDYLGAYRGLRLPNSEVAGAWGLERPLGPLYDARWEKALQLLQIIGFAIPIVIILVYFFARLFTDALNKLAQASRIIASGDYTQPVAMTSLDRWTFDEVGELNQNFEGMRQSLLKKQSAIEVHIAELSRLNQEIQREKGTMEAVLDSLAEALVVVDERGRVVLYNPAAAQLLHLEPGSQGLPLLPLLQARPFEFRLGGDALAERFRRLLEAGEPWQDEVHMPGAVTYQFRCVPITVAGGPVRGGVATFNDVTEMKRIDQLKSDFLSTISHELRTPLTSIRGYLTLVQAGRVADPLQLQQVLAVVLNQTDQLTGLVDNLLELARIEAGRMVLRRQPFLLAEVVAEVLAALRQMAEEKHIVVRADVPADLPAIQGDAERVRQVLTNLVVNALKFTPPGEDRYVQVRARAEADAVRVWVEDNGHGIPAEALPRLFTRFYQVDSSNTRSVGGTGLGLAIVKQIVEEHGGTVSVTSREGEGSVFTFTLPAAVSVVSSQ